MGMKNALHWRCKANGKKSEKAATTLRPFNPFGSSQNALPVTSTGATTSELPMTIFVQHSGVFEMFVFFLALTQSCRIEHDATFSQQPDEIYGCVLGLSNFLVGPNF